MLFGYGLSYLYYSHLPGAQGEFARQFIYAKAQPYTTAMMRETILRTEAHPQIAFREGFRRAQPRHAPHSFNLCELRCCDAREAQAVLVPRIWVEKKRYKSSSVERSRPGHYSPYRSFSPSTR